MIIQNTVEAEVVPLTLRVNDRDYALDIDPRYTLADVLRDRLRLTGLHLGCEQGVCGACMVNVDGQPALSCMIFAVEAQGADIRTIEAVSHDAGGPGRLERAFIEQGAFQCGFCTPGVLVMAHHIVDRGLATSPERVRELLSGNVCRCTGYESIVQAIMSVAQEKP